MNDVLYTMRRGHDEKCEERVRKLKQIMCECADELEVQAESFERAYGFPLEWVLRIVAKIRGEYL